MRDQHDQSRRAQQLLAAAEAGSLTLVTCEGVIVETVQVLDSTKLYHLPRPAIQAYLTAVLAIRHVRLRNKRIYLRAFNIYVTYPRLSFVDALQVAHMEHAGVTTIATFDRGFDRVTGNVRHEP